ncbi:MAG: hypothetical protein ABIW58_03245 [Sphingomicrobium sp.]
MMRARVLAVAAIVLTAAAPAPRAIIVDGAGLTVAAAKPAPAVVVRFGTSRTPALAALGFLGKPKPGNSTDCDGGPLSWAAFSRGLTIYFEDGKFAGWWLARPASGIATRKGIRPGSGRAELRRAHKVAIFQSSLGEEFSAGDMYGLFDDTNKDRVASLYAGRVCTAR